MKKRHATDIRALKRLMAENGFDTIKSLSIAAEIDRNTLGRVLRGEATPSTEIMYKLVDCLHIEPQEAGCIFFSDDLREMQVPNC